MVNAEGCCRLGEPTIKLILKGGRVLALGMFLIAAAAGVAAQTNHENQNMDKEAIRRVLACYVETWNRHDMDAWGKLFTDDVDYVNRGGGWWKSNKGT